MKRSLRNSLFTLLALAFSVTTAWAQLSGTYTIDPSGSGGTNYTSFSAAVSDLNSSGISADVTFNVASGSFSGNISITAFTNSGVYDVVFRGAGKTSTTLSSSSSSATVTLNGGDNITFRDMTIATTAYQAVRIQSTSDDCSFRNCVLDGYNISTTSSTYSTVYLSGVQARRLTIDSCDVLDGSYALYIYGSSSSSNYLEQFTLSNSVVKGYYYRGLHNYYSEGTQIINNTIHGGNGSYSSAYSSYFYLVRGGATTPVRINGNKFINCVGSTMYASSCDGYSNIIRNEMYNNVFQGDHSYSFSYTCYMPGSDYWNIYHNTFASNISSTSTVYSCFYSSGSYVDVQNNTFISSGNYLLYLTNTSNVNEDYNNFFNWSGTGPYYRNGASGPGTNSVSVNQGWASLSDLSIKDGCVNGNNLTSIVGTDIDGNTRSNPPDIGAYEANSGSNDAGVEAILSPTAPLGSGTQTVIARIKNYGSNSLSSVTLNYQVGSASVVSQTFSLTSSLGACASTNLTMSTGFTAPTSCTDFKVWTSSPNSTTDPVASNDTAAMPISQAMTGTYTVYGSSADFSSLAAAFDVLKCAGVSGTVTLKVASGSHTEQVMVPAIPGASSSNRLVIQGAGASSTKISFAQTSSSAHRATLSMDGCAFVEVRDMTIEASGSSYGWAAQVANSESCRIVNCSLIVPTVGSSNFIPLVVGGTSGTSQTSGGVNMNFAIDSSYLSGGYYGMYCYASSSGDHKNVRVHSCKVENYYYYGVYMYYTSGIQFTNNVVEFGTYNYQYVYGVACFNPIQNVVSQYIFNNNTIRSHGYGLQLGYMVNSSMQPGQIINNMIVGGSSNYAVYTTASGSTYPFRNWQIYHNSVNSRGAATYGWYMSGVDSFDFRNNIINQENGGTNCLYSTLAPDGVDRISDYNNYYGTNDLVRYSSTTLDASNLNSSSNYDAHSVTLMTPFTSSSDLHLTDPCFKRGSSIGAVSTDIDGQSRSSQPHLGCDEYPTGTLDIGVAEVLSPNGSVTSGSQSVQFVVSNYGITDIDSFEATYLRTGGSAVTQRFVLSTALKSCEKDTLTFSSGFTFTTGCGEIRVWTSKPNGSTDNVAGNDSSSTVNYGIGMVGTYKVGGSGADFATLQDALDKLNCAGAAGHVVLKLAPDTVSGPWVIPPYQGLSASATLTLDGQGKFLVTNNVTTSSADRATLIFEDAQYTTIRGMKIESVNTSYGWAVQFKGNSTMACGLTNCEIVVPSQTSSSTTNSNAVVISNSTTSYSSNAKCVDCFIDSSIISGGYFAIVGYSDAANPSERLRISHCTIGNSYYYGMYLSQFSGTRIQHNTISNISSQYGYGINLYNYYYNSGYYTSNNEAILITHNQVTAGYPLYTSYTGNSSTDPGLIANNMFYSTYSSGIYFSGTTSGSVTDYWNVYNNTIYVNPNSTSTVYGIYNYYGDYHDTRNNIIHIQSGSSSSYCYYAYYSYNTQGLDYNSYYNNAGSNLMYVRDGTSLYSVNSSNLNSYSGSGFDANSINAMAPFKSATDLHLTDACFERGPSLVSDDIDGDSRSSIGPHLGADEVPTASLDAGVSEILSPTGIVSSGTQTVTVVVSNYGSTSLSSVKVHYAVGSTLDSQTFTLTPSLNACERDTLTFSTGFSHTKGCETIRAWTSSPNGNADGLAINDSSKADFGIPMSGAYTIGGTSGDYATFNEALNALGCAGVSGPVTFNVLQGTYNEQISVGPVAGASNANWITFQSAASNSKNPLMRYESMSTSDNYIVDFNGAAFITFDGIDMENKGSSYSQVINFSNSNKRIMIMNALLQSNISSSAYTINNPSGTGINDSIVIKGNTIKDGYMGIYCYGQSSSVTFMDQDWRIENNIFENCGYYNMYCYYQNNMVVVGNTFNCRPSSTYYAMLLRYCDGAMRITENHISGQTYGYGISQYYCDASSANPAIIANNFISIGNGTSNAYSGIQSYYNSYQKYYHNSIRTHASSGYTTSTTAASVAFGYSSSSYAGNEFINNNVVNAGGGYIVYQLSSTYTYLNSDYNNFYSTGSGNIFQSNSNNYTTLSGFAGYTGSDANSYNVDPKYYSATDLHALTSVLDSAGTSLSAVTIDIDGESRRSSNPSIGADEYTAVDNDAGVTAFLMPEIICSSNTAMVRIQNFGNLNLQSVTINWSVDGVAQSSVSWTGNIAQGSTAEVSLGTFTVGSGTGPVNLMAWTSSPNSQTDPIAKNDTNSTDVNRGISGTFTIAPSGGDFTTFNDALAHVQSRGVCGHVIFDVKEGTYTENLDITRIMGSSPSSTITFRSASTNTNMPVLQFASTNSANYFVVRFNSCDNIIFDGIHVRNTGTNPSYGSAFAGYRSEMNMPHNITIRNCRIEAVESTTTLSVYNAAINFYGGLNAYGYHAAHDILIEKNEILNGAYSGVWFYSTSGSECKNIQIQKNNISGAYYTGIWCYFSDSLTLNDNMISMGANNTSGSTVVLTYSDGQMSIQNNQIFGPNTSNSNTALLLQYCASTSGKESIIANNFISCPSTTSSSQTAGSFLYGSYMNIYHNNFYIGSGTGLSSTGSAAYFYNTSTATGYLNVYNNVFQAEGSQTMAAWYRFSANGNTLRTDYNSYDADYVAFDNSAYTDVASMSAISGNDSNSIDANPYYNSGSDLHVNQSALYMAGMPLGFTKDIDGDSRPTVPTIGAHEIAPNVSVLAVWSDTLCGHDRADGPVRVTLRNDGDIDMHDIPVSFHVDGGAVTTELVAGPLGFGKTETFTLTSKAAFAGYADFMLKAWTSSPDTDRSGDTATGTVPYWPYPVNNFTHADTCYGDAVRFTNTSSVTSGSIASYSWNFGDGSSSTAGSPTHTYSGSGKYMVQLSSISDKGCVDTLKTEVRVMTDLLAGSIGSDQTICYDFSPAALTSTTDASQSAGMYEYQWQMSTDNATWSDITGATSADYAPGNLKSDTYFRRSVKTSIGCGPKYTSSVKITVYDELMAGSISGDQDICYNTVPAALSNTGAPTGGDGTWTYEWERSTDQNNWTTITGATSTGYQPVRLTKTTWYRRKDIGGSGCGFKYTSAVKVNVYDPVDGGIVGPSHESCPNTVPDLLGTTTAASGGDGTYTYKWQVSADKVNWSDIASATSETYQEGVLNKTTHYRRLATSGSGCGSDYSEVATISMAAVPQASFAASNHCFNDVLPLTNFSNIKKGSITNYMWYFGDGNTSSDLTPKHTYQTDGKKTIKLVVTSNIGCLDSTERSVTVSNIPTASFSSFYDCDVDSIRFKNTTSVNCGKINAFRWEFGDGKSSSLQNPTHRYASSGTYTVKLVIDLPGGFSDSVFHTVSQYERSTASFTTNDVCFGENVTFTNSSTNAVSYDWDFADNNLSKLTSPSHFYRVIGKYTVKLKAYDGNGCFATTSASVTVKVKPVAYFTTDNRCDGDSVPFFNGTDYGDTYSWDFGDNSTSTQKDPKHLYGTSGSYDITLYAFNNNGCKDTSYGKTNVWVLPSASFSVGNGCVGQKIDFTNSSSTASQYVWSFGDGQNATGRDASHVYGSAGTYTAKLEIVTTEGCSDMATATVTIYDNPVADFAVGDVCLGTATSFTNNSSLKTGTMSYTWDFGDGTGSSMANPVHTYAAAGSYTVSLKVDAPGGCSDMMVKTVQVKVQPASAFTATTACAGTATMFTNNSTNANSYSWTFGDGNSSSAFEPRHTYASAGTYTVTLKAMNANGCEHVSTMSVTVNPMPMASISANTVCAGTATMFTNNTTISAGSLSYSWDFGDGSSSTQAAPSHTYAGAGTYVAILTASSAAGCTDKASVSVVVNANPVADFAGTNVCVGNATTLMNYSTGATSYTWNFGDGSAQSTAQSPSHTYATANTYTVLLTARNAVGCSSVKSVNVVVYAAPTASFSQNNACVGTAMNFTNSSSTGTYLWTFGDGGTSTASSPSYTYTKSGSFNVNLKVTNGFGCESDVTRAVTVYAAPKAGFTAGDACLGSATSFSNNSTGATSYSWDFGDGRTSSSASPSNTYAAAGTYTVTLVATSANGCTNTFQSKVAVNTNPTASFTANNVCLGDMVNFTNTSSTGASSWNFGDGSTGNTGNPSHSYAAAGSYNVRLTVTNAAGCRASFNRTVQVNAVPTVSFSSNALCSGPEASFTNTSSGASSYSWSFGDGKTSTQSDPTHMYSGTGTYLVRLTGTSGAGCKASTQATVQVYSAAVADFSAAGVCAGNSTSFINLSSNAVKSSWNFGDGNSSTAVLPTHTYASSGNYNVTLQVENAIGCSKQVTKVVNVYVNPVSSFTAANGCQGDVLNFTNNSTNGASYLWNFGDGSTSTAMGGSHTYSGNGSRTITLKVVSSNGCTSESSRTIEVYERPFANFAISNTCEGELTRFVNTSLNGASYSWAFGDGSTSTIENPTHQYASSGSYTASLTVNNSNCSDTYSMPFAINAAPDAGFTFDVAGRDVNFTANTTTGVSSYEWDFNDGSGSGEASPKHVYGKAIQQTFNVCLRVTDVNGCSSQECEDVSVDILGAKEVDRSNFAIYPNPTSGMLHVQLDQVMGDVSIEVMDMIGNIVRVPQTDGGTLRYSLDISDLAEGVYLVRVVNGQVETTQRVVLSK
ncbi:MAG: PKD domain-containing protein [Flavobacteriales bacterium]|nr:PKD domain-containing protein [Flavobacteriales bacterium]